jgi:predicted nucleotidyltransferase
MAQVNEKILGMLVRAIVNIADPAQIILFGSAARGEAGGDSDLDILVVVSGSFNRRRCRTDLYVDIMTRLGRFNIPLDLLLFTRSEVREWRPYRNHVISRALREGMVLYEKKM